MIRLVLIVIGLAMLLSGTCDRLAPRARFVGSSPAPGAVVDAVPKAVSVTFSEPLAAQSTMAVASTITLSESGEEQYGDGRRFEVRGSDSDDGRRTMRVELAPGIPPGLYWVNWTAVAMRGNARRSGHLCFAVGMPVPTHILRDDPGGLRERDYKERGRRALITGGVIFILLGAFLPLGGRTSGLRI